MHNKVCFPGWIDKQYPIHQPQLSSWAAAIDGGFPHTPKLVFRTGRHQLMVSQGSSHVRPVLTAALKPAESSKSPARLFSVGSVWLLADHFPIEVALGIGSLALLTWLFTKKGQQDSKEQIFIQISDMPTTSLETNESLSLIAEYKIESLRQKYEKDYARLHDETFNLTSLEFFRELAIAISFSTQNKFLVADRFKQAAELTTQFINRYQEVYSAEFGESLKKLEVFFKAHQTFFQASALLDLGDEQTDNAIKYIKYCEGYQLFGSLVNEYWYSFSVGIRKSIEEFAYTLQSKTGFEDTKNSWDELKQLWKELGQQLKLFTASIRGGGKDLFIEYKKAVVYFISSTVEAVEKDQELKKYKESEATKISPEKNQTTQDVTPSSLDILLENIFLEAIKETKLLKEKGFYLSDYSLITPLAWLASQHPEIAEKCNEALEEIVSIQESELKGKKIDWEKISKYEF